MPAIVFPFARETWYPIADFAPFEDGVLAARRRDAALDLALSTGREPWMKLRNEELYPLIYFARHTADTDRTFFRICAEGSESDVELRDGERTRRFQITTAGPLWSPGDPNWGRGHALQMQKLKREGQVSGWGPFTRTPDGSISNRDEAISSEERDPAYMAGLMASLLGKRSHRSRHCELLVYAVGYAQAMSLTAFLNLATSALVAVPIEGFSRVHVFDYVAGYITSSRP